MKRTIIAMVMSMVLTGCTTNILVHSPSAIVESQCTISEEVSNVVP